MIHFKTVRWKNFLSTGNAFTEIQLDKHPTTLIIGENGSGKSTLLDAICFALFGKPFRNINKPQLTNTINNKKCIVQIEFNIGSKEYKIVRGLKPAVFEIWANGELLNQDAASKDYQKFLEESILKLNFKSFTQIVILGAASFTPFMQLPAAARREVIEDILDIKIFTAMNTVLKQKVSELKESMTETDAKIEIAKNKVQTQQNYIKTLQDDRDAKIAELEEKIKETVTEVTAKSKTIKTLDKKREEYFESINDSSSLQQEISKVINSLHDFDKLSASIKKEIDFYHDNDNCPKCKQGIDHSFKSSIISEHQEELKKIVANKQQLQDVDKRLQARMKEVEEINKQISNLTTQMNEIKNEISSSERFVQRLELEKAEIKKKVGNIETEKEKLKEMAKEALKIAKDRSDMNETNHYYDVAGIMLKDTGIKTRIIKQYLPVINKLVNKYLTAMDFFVQFTLDEKFTEVIKSRYRDDFSYESFSEGEKQRIDLALLFTWRTIAKLKNSASTNLLILDEVFDSSLDNSATDYVMNLLNTLGDGTNVWVISHKGDQLFDKFSHIIKFTKKQNFSVIA